MHVCVDLQVACYDNLHLLHIVIDVTVFGVLALNVLNQFTLLSDHMGHFLEVLEMVGPELLLLLHDVINFLVEGQHVFIDHGLSLARIKSHPQVVHLRLTVLWCLPVIQAVTWAGISCATPTTSSRSVAPWTCIRTFWCSHRGWILWGSTNALCPRVVPWTHVTALCWTDRVCSRTPACTFALLSLQVALATLPRLSYVLVDSGQRVS